MEQHPKLATIRKHTHGLFASAGDDDTAPVKSVVKLLNEVAGVLYSATSVQLPVALCCRTLNLDAVPEGCSATWNSEGRYPAVDMQNIPPAVAFRVS